MKTPHVKYFHSFARCVLCTHMSISLNVVLFVFYDVMARENGAKVLIYSSSSPMTNWEGGTQGQ